MRLFLFCSDMIIPVIILGIVCYGVTQHVDVYESFIKGANSGFQTVIKIMPNAGSDDSGRHSEGVRTSGSDRYVDWKYDGSYWISWGISTAYGGEDVLIISGNRSVTGFV